MTNSFFEILQLLTKIIAIIVMIITAIKIIKIIIVFNQVFLDKVRNLENFLLLNLS